MFVVNFFACLRILNCLKIDDDILLQVCFKFIVTPFTPKAFKNIN